MINEVIERHQALKLARVIEKIEKEDAKIKKREKQTSIVDFFCSIDHFCLDFKVFSSLIYILYEGGRLRPPLVRPRFRAFQLGVLTSRRKNGEKGWKEKGRQEAVRQPSHRFRGCSHGTPSFFDLDDRSLPAHGS